MLPTSHFTALTSDTSSETTLAAILYDLDGTLANTDPFHYRAWQEMLRPFGFEIDEAFYKTRISGRLNPAIVADLLPQLMPEAGEQFAAQKEARFRELAPQLTRLAGLSDLLHWATVHRLKQAVVTNAPAENVYHTLKALHLESSFEQVIIAEELGVGKPDPAPYLHALAQLDVAPERAIAFEDSPSGIRSAVAAGIPTVGIASTQSPSLLYSVGAILVVTDFTAPELKTLLAQQVGELNSSKPMSLHLPHKKNPA